MLVTNERLKKPEAFLRKGAPKDFRPHFDKGPFKVKLEKEKPKLYALTLATIAKQV